MGCEELLCHLEHPPPSPEHKKKRHLLRPVLRRFLPSLAIFLTFFNLPNLISTIQDISPGFVHLVPGLDDEREKAIQEILAVLEQQETDLARVTQEELAEAIYEESRRHNQDPKFILAIIGTESSFRNWSVSEKGAKGLMQIMPYVAESLARELGIEWLGDRTLFNPYLNVKLGVYYLSQLIVDFQDLALALTAYNYGPTYVRSLLENNEEIPLHFYRRILTVYRNLHGVAALPPKDQASAKL